MSWVKLDEITFYAAVFLVGFFSSASMFLADQERPSILQSLGLSFVGGLLSFAFVALTVGRIEGPIIGHMYYLGIATVIGLSSRQAERIRAKLFDFILAQRIVIGKSDGTKDEDKTSDG